MSRLMEEFMRLQAWKTQQFLAGQQQEIDLFRQYQELYRQSLLQQLPSPVEAPAWAPARPAEAGERKPWVHSDQPASFAGSKGQGRGKMAQPREKKARGSEETNQAGEKGKASSPVQRNAEGEPIDPWQWEDRPTTVMVRRLPRSYNQRQFLELLESFGFTGLFDFIYLPWDIMLQQNMGCYAFVNFREPEYALMFREECRRRQVEGKMLQVHPAQLQGYEANHQHFSNSKIGHHESLRPIFMPQTSWQVDY